MAAHGRHTSNRCPCARSPNGDFGGCAERCSLKVSWSAEGHGFKVRWQSKHHSFLACVGVPGDAASVLVVRREPLRPQSEQVFHR